MQQQIETNLDSGTSLSTRVRRKTITNSSRCTFLSCPYKYYCEYIQLLSPKHEPEYFQWGSLVHRYAEEYGRGLSMEQILPLVYEEIEKRAHFLSPLATERLEAMITTLPSVFRAHDTIWGEYDKAFEVMESERHFSWQLPDSNEWWFEGKIDGYRRHIPSGEIYQWERKTAGKTGDTYWQRIPLDSQPKGYILASQRSIGLDVDKVIYDLFKKPALQQGKYETIEEYYRKLALNYESKPQELMERGPYNGVVSVFHFTPEDIDSYYWDLVQVTQMLDWHIQNGIWPKHHPGNLVGGCVYFPLCIATSESELEQRKNTLYYRREEFHPELK
jgi:hypothetical protein